MKKSVIGAVALLSVVGLTAGASAQEPPPISTQRAVGRFHQVAVPAHVSLSNLPSHTDPKKVVSATVVLAADSVASAQQRAASRGEVFDRAGALASARDAQSSLIPRLTALGVKVQNRASTVIDAVTVRGTVAALTKVAALSGITSIHISSRITRDNGTSDLYTGVTQAWNDLGLTGKGMTVGIIDTGIDYYHADFGGTNGAAKYAADDDTVIEPGTFPTAKVVGGYDFVGDAYNADPTSAAYDPNPVPDPDPLDCGEHGTHVAGTVAGQGVLADGTTYTGPYNASTIASHSWKVAPGAAPEASIRSYKVFGCAGSVNDDVILAAIDRAVADGVNVISMSLGSTWGTNTDPLTVAIDNATKAGVLTVVAAGNEGSAAYVVGSPSTADTALSVAAADVSSSTLPGVAISGDVTLNAQNSNDWDYSTPVSGQLVDVGLGCSDAEFAPAAGKIAVAHRGTCTRVERAVHAKNAGALGVIFVNTSDGYPPVEGAIPGGEVPFVGVPLSAGAQFTNGKNITLSASAPIPNPAYTNFADFSSNGPTLDNFAKPDVTAPGVSIVSAGMGTGTDSLLLSGTSMATPHTSGIALLVRQAHPGWSPSAVKAAIMDTASQTKVGDYDTQRGGAGMVEARPAVDTVSYLTTPEGRDNLSFGFRQLDGAWSATKSITITNTSRSTITYDLSAQLNTLGLHALSVSISPQVARVEGRHSLTVQVTIRIKDPQNLPAEANDDFGALAALDGLFVATPRSSGTGVYTLKTPILLVPYGLSDVQASPVSSSRTDARTVATSGIRLLNSGVHSGTFDTYQWAASDPQGDNPGPLVPDLRAAGVQQFNLQPGADLLVFGVSTFDRITSQATKEYQIWIDTNRDGTPDYLVDTADVGLATTGTPNGLLESFFIDLSSGAVTDAWVPTAPNNGSTIEIPFLVQDLGTLSGPVNFEIDSYSVQDGTGPDTMTGMYDPAHPAVSTGDFGTLAPNTGGVLPVTSDLTAAAAQHALGWMVISLDDAAGAREANLVPLTVRGGR